MHDRAHRALLLIALMTASACGDDPAVEINTRVGPAHIRVDDQAKRAEYAKEVLTALLPVREPTASIADAPAIVSRPPATDRELNDLVDAIRHAPLAEIGGPARRIAAAGPKVWPRVEQLLAAEPAAARGDYPSVLAAIGGDVPNRYGHFALRWKKAHGHTVKLSEDWLGDLLALPHAKISSGLVPAYRDAVLRVAIIHAAANTARSDRSHAAAAMHALLDFAFAEKGLYRDEVARAIEAVGEPAVPHLVVAAVVPPHKTRHELEPWVLRPRFAEDMLDRLDRLHPARAIGAVADDPQLLSDVIAAYGVVRRAEATPVVLAHVDSTMPKVRAAARVAWLAYVAGPAPRVVGRQIKLLGGGTAQAQAYLTYRERALLSLRDELTARAPDLLEPPCDEKRPDGSTDARCEAQALNMTMAWFQHLDGVRDRARREAIDAALASRDPAEGVRRIDRLLAQGEGLAREPDVARYLDAAARHEHAQGRPERAAQLWRKAAVIGEPVDATLARELHVRALLAEASVASIDAGGRAMLLRAAAELRPDDPRITAALARARASDPSTPTRGIGIGFAALALLIIVLHAIGFALRRRHREPTTIA